MGKPLIQEWDRLPLILTAGQVANILQLNRRTVTDMCARQEITATKIAGDWRITRDELMRLIGANPTS
jgi:excisionase family DNA binding protein